MLSIVSQPCTCWKDYLQWQCLLLWWAVFLDFCLHTHLSFISYMRRPCFLQKELPVYMHSFSDEAINYTLWGFHYSIERFGSQSQGILIYTRCSFSSWLLLEFRWRHPELIAWLEWSVFYFLAAKFLSWRREYFSSIEPASLWVCQLSCLASFLKLGHLIQMSVCSCQVLLLK